MVLPLLIATVGLSSLFFVWLIQPGHFPKSRYLPTPVHIGNLVMFWTIVVSEGIRLLNSITLCWAAYIMRNPVPVRPPAGLRIAFTTTIVPSKEPLDVVRDTLIAARQIRYGTPIDIWLLDEGDDPTVRQMCKDLGVNHFSRKGVERWNQPKGRFRAKTKHGNHNSWLDAHGGSYDVVLSVDPDHIPLPNFASRMLGYFRDPDVAFVVGPQVYGNFHSFLTRGAEAQNYMFHSVIQRAANRFDCGMFVGTNHAYRVSAWRQIGGFQDSITEDLATSFAVHGEYQSDSGKHWKSVYTPDVVAVGEGPATWTDFFSQQLRWARGSNEVLVTESVRRLRKLPWGHRLHYSTLMLHYPTVALTWLMGMMLTVSYMALGSTGVTVQISSWLALYIDVAVARLLLYIWLRRFNISPHEEKGTAGISGIFVSMLCTPFYSTAFVGALLRRPLGFVVTPKGQSASPDRLLTFRKHIFWATISGISIATAVGFGHVYPANMVWAALSLIICLLPIFIWWGSLIAGRLRPVGEPGLLPAVASEQPGIPRQATASEASLSTPAASRPAAARTAVAEAPVSETTAVIAMAPPPATTEKASAATAEKASAATTEKASAATAEKASAATAEKASPARTEKASAAAAEEAAPAAPEKAAPGKPAPEEAVPGKSAPEKAAPSRPKKAAPGRSVPAAASATASSGYVEEVTKVLRRPAALSVSASGGRGEEVTQTTVVPALSASAPGGYREEATQTIILPAVLSSLGPAGYSEEATQKLIRPTQGAGSGKPGKPGKPARRAQDAAARGGRSAVAVAASAEQPAAGGSVRGRPGPGTYTEEATMKLMPRRRRVSGDGLLEELT
ncbi:glycosyltransferase family 2 protein [Frankia sp. CiP1_Cm_nod1]|uniref:glycosyltransferase family 2 protein n=1 Tax=Frankia sp. CiP1_Cm_nod1 TaxID=2897160 RepID=UPI00202581A1